MSDFLDQAEKALEGITPGPWERLQTGCVGDPYANIKIKPLMGVRTVAELSLDDAPVEDFNREQRANARFIAAAPTLLRQAITEVRDLEKAWINAEAKIEVLKAENAKLCGLCVADAEYVNKRSKARIEALEGQVQVADMLANKLKAENAKLREAAMDADRKAEAGICQVGAVGKHEFLKDVRKALSAALGSDGPGDAQHTTNKETEE